MDFAKFREYCLSKPNATEGTPFGPDTLVFKVGGKIFAITAFDKVPAREFKMRSRSRARITRSL